MENKRELTDDDKEIASDLIKKLNNMNKEIQEIKRLKVLAELFEYEKYIEQDVIMDINYMEDVNNRTKKYLYERFGIDYDKINKE